MPYQDSVQSSIVLQTTVSQGADLSTLMFISSNNYIPFRTLSFGSIQEVRENSAIQDDSNTYAALRLGFSAGAGRIMLGRRAIDKAIYTPDTTRIGKVTVYSLTVSTGTDSVTATYTSSTGDDAETILTDLAADITASDVDVTATVVGTLADATLEIADTTTVNHVVSDSNYLTATFESTETAADCLAEILDEAEEDFYFITAEDHTETFILEMAAEVEATESANYPKQYHVAVQDANVLTPLADPAVDVLGKLKELGYTRTSGRWHHNADELFPEVYPPCAKGQFLAGTTNWKFAIPKGIDAASDPVTGKRLSTAKQGYIVDRDANWFGYERGITFNREGNVASGEWITNILIKDYLNNEIETALLNLQLNVSTNGKIAFTSADKTRVANVVDGILKRGVDNKQLSGFEPTTIPDNTPFADQGNRILQNINFTGYLASEVNTMIVNGVLTYQDESLA